MRSLLAVLLLSLAATVAGCAAPSLQLDPKWAPLTTLEEDATLPANTGSTTGHIMTYYSLSAWQAGNPASQTALLAHEQQHSIRQFAAGVAAWCARYANDPAFRLAEEKIGYKVEIKSLQAAGVAFEPAQFATAMSSSPIYKGMITYADALAWVDAVVDGTQ